MDNKMHNDLVAGAWSQLGDCIIGGDGVGGGGSLGGLRSPSSSSSSLATMTQSLPGHHTTAAGGDEKWRQLLHVTAMRQSRKE